MSVIISLDVLFYTLHAILQKFGPRGPEPKTILARSVQGVEKYPSYSPSNSFVRGLLLVGGIVLD